MSEIKESKPKSKAYELYELRKEIMEIDYKLKLVEKNCSTLNINLRKTEVVQKEIEKLDQSNRVFDRCGRIFVLSTKDQILQKLAETKKKMIAELDSQNMKKKTFEKEITDKSKNYMEEVKAAEKNN